MVSPAVANVVSAAVMTCPPAAPDAPVRTVPNMRASVVITVIAPRGRHRDLVDGHGVEGVWWSLVCRHVDSSGCDRRGDATE